MVLGWRRAFCTSIPKEKEPKLRCNTDNTTRTPRLSSKFGFLSNPLTPRFQSEPVSNPSLRCRPSVSAGGTPNSSLPSSPKFRCKTTSNATPSTSPKKNASPSLFSSFSNPSSPKSPFSSFSLLKSTLRNNKSNKCGICLQGMITGQAIFTAECSHPFHFPCIVTLANKRCPVCAAAWREAPLHPPFLQNAGSDPRRIPEPKSKIREVKTKSLRVYNDDESLTLSPVSLAPFNTIPESEENDDAEEENDFPGFFVNTTSLTSSSKLTDQISRNLEVKLQPEAAVVAVGRRYETHAVVMKVRAPPHPDAPGSRRPPVDLVTVLDVSGGAVKLQMIKRAMRLVISLLRERDRLSIVVFTSGSKRLLPLRRMTAEGRRTARRIVDALFGRSGTGMSINDAVKKAAKVIEDRRERNPLASIFVLSDGQDNPAAQSNPKRSPFLVSTTRFCHLEIPVHSVWIGLTGALDNASLQDAFTERIAGLLRVVLKDVTLQLGLGSGSSTAEISSVYSLAGRPESFGSGSVRLGDLVAGEEIELLVELKVPASSTWSHLTMSVRSTSVEPTSHQPIYVKERRLLVPHPQAVRTSPSIVRLRNLHVSARAVAESRRVLERDDLSGAYQLLSSARALLVQSRASSADECLRGLETELDELSRRRQRTNCADQVEEKAELLTATSAWRAAERLAKVAITRRHMKRVSDLHGLENARF